MEGTRAHGFIRCYKCDPLRSNSNCDKLEFLGMVRKEESNLHQKSTLQLVPQTPGRNILSLVIQIPP